MAGEAGKSGWLVRFFPAGHTARPPLVGPADGGDRNGIVAMLGAARITPRGMIFGGLRVETPWWGMARRGASATIAA